MAEGPFMDPHFAPVPPAPPRFLEVSHVAHRLGFSQEFVRRLIRRGKLKARRLESRYRVDPADLQAYIDSAPLGGNGHA